MCVRACDMTSNAFTGQCFDVHTGHPIPGLEYVLGTDTNPQLYDTIVMANLVSLFLSCLLIVSILFYGRDIFS